MYTEEEARANKWCPMLKISGGGDILHDNRESSMYNCIASDCMMWKWELKVIAVEYGNHGETYNKTVNSDKGRCGLTK